MGKVISKAKGRIKQAVGALTGNKTLKAEGVRDERRGKVEGAVEGVTNAAKDAKDAVAEAVK